MKNRMFLLSLALVAAFSVALNQQSNPIVSWFSPASSAEAAGETRTFGVAGRDAVAFFFIEKAIKPFVDGVAIDDDPATTLKICNLAGYARVQSVSSRNFASCGDNFVEYWNGSQWIRDAACTRQPTIDTLVCVDLMTQCNDGIDNDGDGAIDSADFSCGNGGNNESTPKSSCQDGIDNDGDGKVDLNDPGCANAQDNDEYNAPAAQCKDGADNDGDQLIDASDPGCHTDFNRFNSTSYDANGTNESSNNLGTCANGRDDDSDGLIDAQDPICHTDGNPNNNASFDPTKNEIPVSSAQCNDNVDNDGDGQVDINDPGCHTDKNRFNSLSYNPNGIESDNNRSYTCQDGVDNNNNGQIDAQDPICHTDGNANNAASFNPNGNEGFGGSSSSSSNGAQCNDNVDNDNDGQTDIADPGCHTDRNRFNSASYNPYGFESDNNRSYTCQDGVDNNNNGQIDAQDAVCHTDGNPNNNASFNPNGNEGFGSSSSSSSNGINNGCVNVKVRAEDEDGNRITKDLDGFTITIDGNLRSDETDDDGEVQFKNLSHGSHYVNIELDGDWDLDYVNPTNGNVTISGSSCRTVTFNIVDTDDNGNNNGDDADVRVRKTASAGEVFPGGTIEYTITIENTGDVDLQDLVVEDRIPSDLTILDDGDADDRNGNELTWNIDVDEGDTETIRYRVAIPTYMYPGQSIRNDVNVSSDDNDFDIDEDASAFVTVIGSMPQTGAFGTVATTASAYLTPMASSAANTASGSGSAAALFTTVLTGLGGGVGLGRKFLTRS